MSEQWAVVELMGHVRTAGRISEEERFGGTMGRLDIPIGDSESEYVTTYFHSSSVYRVTFTSEAAARAVASQNMPAPVHSWEMPILRNPESLTDKTIDPQHDRDFPF